MGCWQVGEVRIMGRRCRCQEEPGRAHRWGLAGLLQTFTVCSLSHRTAIGNIRSNVQFLTLDFDHPLTFSAIWVPENWSNLGKLKARFPSFSFVYLDSANITVFLCRSAAYICNITK